MPTPWPPPALSRYSRHLPASLCSEPGVFPFPRRTSASFSLLMLTGLSAISPFWGMLTPCQGPGITSYQLLMGTWQSRFHEHPKTQDKLCWRKDSGILELQAVNCVAMLSKKHFGFQLAVPWRQPLRRCVRPQVLFQNIDDYFTNPCLMAASAAVGQDGCLKSLLNAKI